MRATCVPLSSGRSGITAACASSELIWKSIPALNAVAVRCVKNFDLSRFILSAEIHASSKVPVDLCVLLSPGDVKLDDEMIIKCFEREDIKFTDEDNEEPLHRG